MPPGTRFWERMQPLGALRCRILACLGADNPKLPTFFDPTPDQPLHECLHQHLLKLYDKCAADPESRRIVAAGLLSFGELARADEILSQLPREPMVIDHGAGWCSLIAYSVVATLLPIPEEHGDPRRWIQGSSNAAAVVQWLDTHRSRLRCDSNVEGFVLG
jgi:hypothetical protein